MPYEQSIAPEAFCLGSPVHLMSAEMLLCPTCQALRAGALVGGYQIQRLLGKGRSGTAYQVFQQELSQYAVLKLLPSDLASNELWLLARQEIRAISALQHPSCLPVSRCTFWSPARSFEESHDEWRRRDEDGYLLTLYQYAAMGNWATLLSDYQQRLQNLTEELQKNLQAQLIHYIRQIGTALSAVHQMGLVHGALMPGNIVLDQQQLWVADWGLARLAPPLSPFLAPELRSYFQSGRSAEYQLWYWYAATPASDQYALAVLCQPFLAYVLPSAYYQRVLPLLNRATHELPQQRFASVVQFIDALEEFMEKLNTSLSRSPPPLALDGAGEHTQDQPEQPAFSENWERTGGKHFAGGHYEEALQAYQLAVDLDATNVALWAALGDTYFALQRYQEALQAYDQALTLKPRDVVVWENKGTVLALMGRHAEARVCSLRVRELQAES
jgi:serine/threonine protein kinase